VPWRPACRSPCGTRQAPAIRGWESEGKAFPRQAAGSALPCPSNDTAELIAFVTLGEERIFREGFRYKKAGVTVTELAPEATAQLAMFDDRDRQCRRKLMTAIDNANGRSGSGTVFCAAQGIKQPWKMQRGHLSLNYTTRWDELMSVMAK
jgi:DNA polymerase V